MAEVPTEALEAAARTLFEHDRMPDDPPWDEMYEADRDSYREAVSAVVAAAAPFLTGGHHYLSSACYHHGTERPELHLECQTNATRWDGTEKIAAQCKYCEARCVCPCHRDGGG